MSENKDGIEKNIEVYIAQGKEWWTDTKRNVRRLLKWPNATAGFNPKNREHFLPHVLKAFLTTTLKPYRIWAEVIILYLLYAAIAVFNGWPVIWFRIVRLDL